MALPKLNDTPKYELTIPSNGIKVKFRPYLVKEEKVLMLAFESQDQIAGLNAVIDTIKSCVHEKIDLNTLTLFDVEYMFTKIRSKSVGESVNIVATCNSCEHKNELSLNIDDISIDIPEISNKIELTDDIVVELEWPSYMKTVENSELMTTTSETLQTIQIIADCLVSIETQEENILFKDEPRESIIEFLESLTNAQFDKLKSFVEQMPVLEKRDTYTCVGCKKTNTIVIRNLADFF